MTASSSADRVRTVLRVMKRLKGELCRKGAVSSRMTCSMYRRQLQQYARLQCTGWLLTGVYTRHLEQQRSGGAMQGLTLLRCRPGQASGWEAVASCVLHSCLCPPFSTLGPFFPFSHTHLAPHDHTQVVIGKSISQIIC